MDVNVVYKPSCNWGAPSWRKPGLAIASSLVKPSIPSDSMQLQNSSWSKAPDTPTPSPCGAGGKVHQVYQAIIFWCRATLANGSFILPNRFTLINIDLYVSLKVCQVGQCLVEGGSLLQPFTPPDEVETSWNINFLGGSGWKLPARRHRHGPLIFEIFDHPSSAIPKKWKKWMVSWVSGKNSPGLQTQWSILTLSVPMRICGSLQTSRLLVSLILIGHDCPH